MNRKIYLEDKPLEEAENVFIRALSENGLWRRLPAEEMAIADALGRITAEAVWAEISTPHYHASAMDGFALRSADTEGATETSPLQFSVVSGELDQLRGERPAQMVNTGQPMPVWADCVVMIENTQETKDEQGQPGIEIYSSIPPWRHVRPMGEDMVATELVLPANHCLRPVDLGALAAAGHSKVAVRRKPIVAVLPTGSELTGIEELENGPPKPGQIIEFNSIVLAAQVESWGGRAVRSPIIADNPERIAQAVIEASKEADLILINAGSSAGSEDYTARVVETLGDLLVHGVAVRPGHPVILGIIRANQIDSEADRKDENRSAVPVIGVPGYPVSAALTGEIFVEPLLARWLGRRPREMPTVKARITRKLISHTGDDDFIRVSVGKVGDNIVATPLSRGAGVISSLVRADGLVRIPRFSEGLEAGEEVDVRLYRSIRQIENTILAIGSHDLTIDLMAQFLAQLPEGLRLSSANVGSLGGLLALRRQESHMAGCHLLDRDSGGYNDAFVRRYLPGQEVAIVTLVGREQGWIVPEGNPKGITSWQDASDPEIKIVNRQRGAGTRELLDYELKNAGIDPDEVRGYSREEYTHLAVAAAVASGTADAGPGIRAAARALGLDFVFLAYERYELIIPRQHFESELLQPLIALLSAPDFREAVQSMPGYDAGPMGNFRWIKS